MHLKNDFTVKEYDSHCAVEQQPVDDEPDDGHDDPADVEPDEGADEDDGVEDEVGDGEVLGPVLHRDGARAAAEVVKPDAHLGGDGWHYLSLNSLVYLGQ